MNRIVAQAFAGIIAVLHVLALIGFVVALVLGGLPASYVPQTGPLSDLPLAEEGGRLLPLIAGAVGYVLAMGLVATLISINQNLDRLANAAERQAGPE